MTSLEIYFYIALPAGIVTAAWIAVRINEHNDRNHRIHPGD